MPAMIPRRRWLRRALAAAASLALLEVLLRIVPLPGIMPSVPPVPLEPYLMFGYLHQNPRYRTEGLEIERPPAGESLAEKPAGEVRVLVLGGSVAYGTGASSRAACWDRRLEAMLAARRGPGDRRTFRVVNRARPSYNTTQAFVSLSLEGLGDQPDAVVFLDGFNDLAVPVLLGGAPGDPYYLVEMRAQMGLQPGWRRLLRDIHGSVRLVQAGAALFRDPKRFDVRLLTEAGRAEVRRIAGRNLALMADLLRARGIPGLLVAEPFASQKTPLSPEEAAHLADLEWAAAFAREYPPHAQALLGTGRAEGWTVLDATGLFRGVAGRRFFDTLHLVDEGQEEMAGAVADALAPHVGLTPGGGAP